MVEGVRVCRGACVQTTSGAEQTVWGAGCLLSTLIAAAQVLTLNQGTAHRWTGQREREKKRDRKGEKERERERERKRKRETERESYIKRKINL